MRELTKEELKLVVGGGVSYKPDGDYYKNEVSAHANISHERGVGNTKNLEANYTRNVTENVSVGVTAGKTIPPREKSKKEVAFTFGVHF